MVVFAGMFFLVCEVMHLCLVLVLFWFDLLFPLSRGRKCDVPSCVFVHFDLILYVLRMRIYKIFLTHKENLVRALVCV